HVQRHPDAVRRWQLIAAEVFRSHADDRKGMIVDHDLFADHALVPIPTALPKPMTNHGDRISPRGFVLFWPEITTGRHAHAQGPEVVGGNHFSDEPFSEVVSRDAEGRLRESGHLAEHGVSSAQ